MSKTEGRGLRFLVIALAALIVVLGANALIDFGTLLHNLTYSH